MPLTQVDRDLLNRCLNNESGAWNSFVDRFVGLIVHVVNHTAHSRSVRLTDDDADDIKAEVFYRLLKRDAAILRRFRGESSLATYLTVVVRRIVVREIAKRRKAQAMGHVSAYGASASRTQQEEGSVNEEIPRIEDRDHIDKLIAGLSDTEASVIRLFHLEGKSYQEISNELKISQNTIGPTLSRAREYLKRQGASS